MRSIKAVTIAITLDTGELAVMQFVTNGRGQDLPSGATWTSTVGVWDREPTPENIAAEVRKTFAGHTEQPVSWRLVPDGAVPVDRAYRAAWADVNGAIAHDMTKARTIHRDRIRQARADKLAALDVAYQRADEENNPQEKARITAAKQALRDLPADPAIDAAQTIAQLKAHWPPALT